MSVNDVKGAKSADVFCRDFMTGVWDRLPYPGMTLALDSDPIYYPIYLSSKLFEKIRSGSIGSTNTASDAGPIPRPVIAATVHE